MAGILRKGLLVAMIMIILVGGTGYSAPRQDKQLYDAVLGKLPKDDRAPDMYISVIAPTGKHGWYNTPVSFLVKSWDSGSGVAREEVSIGGGTWYKKSLTIRKDGKYIVYGKAVDRAGNASVTWVKVNIDMTPPEAKLTIPEPNGYKGWYVGSVPVTLTGSDLLSGVFETNFLIEGNSMATNISPWDAQEAFNDEMVRDYQQIIKGENVTVDFAHASMVESGIYHITGYVEDIAGNRTLIDHTAMLDLVPPDVEIHSPKKFFGAISLEGSLLDYDSGVKNLYVDTGSGWQTVKFTSEGNWAADWSTDDLKDGKYLIKAKVVDTAGNQSFAYYTAIVLNNIWPFFAFSGVLISLAVIASYDPRRKAWQEFGLTLAKVAHMEKNAIILKKDLK
ncbi:MAG: Ig-like domain-containing protein [Pelolinea sp.]|nr:Ig-like domain-containing protein [Pelolinea sp.]